MQHGPFGLLTRTLGVHLPLGVSKWIVTSIHSPVDWVEQAYGETPSEWPQVLRRITKVIECINGTFRHLLRAPGPSSVSGRVSHFHPLS